MINFEKFPKGQVSKLDNLAVFIINQVSQFNVKSLLVKQLEF